MNENPPKNIKELGRQIEEAGIAFQGRKGEESLLQNGYFHLYKGYRFYQKEENLLPFERYDDLLELMKYDMSLKEILFGKVVFLETAVRNITLQSILDYTGSDTLETMMDKAIVGFGNCPEGTSLANRREAQRQKNKLRTALVESIQKAHNSGVPKIVHYYEESPKGYVPLWAIFEIMDMGTLDFILHSLVADVRKMISERMHFDVAMDTGWNLPGKCIYALHLLRNAIAHNDVIYDCRFMGRWFHAKQTFLNWIKSEAGVNDADFTKIESYFVLVTLMLRHLDLPKKEWGKPIQEYSNASKRYEKKVFMNIYTVTIPFPYERDMREVLLKIANNG